MDSLNSNDYYTYNRSQNQVQEQLGYSFYFRHPAFANDLENPCLYSLQN